MTQTISGTNIKFTPIDTEGRDELDLKSGDTVRVYQKIEEKGKTRLQIFEGLVLAVKHGKEMGATFTVRKIASGVGVEKIFPLYSPNIDKIEIVKKSKSHSAKLYYVRDKAAKEIRSKMRQMMMSVPESTTDYDVKEVTEESIDQAEPISDEVKEKTEAIDIKENNEEEVNGKKEETKEEPVVVK